MEAARRAGVSIDWTVEGPLHTVPDTVGLALYRIVQESLSNTSRHAPHAAVHASLIVRMELVELLIVDTPGESPARGTPGTGIAGMRARAQAFGGTLTAGPGADGGFRVHALLPAAPAAPDELVPAALQ